MLSSAVSSALLLGVIFSGPQLDATDLAALKRIEPTLVRVLQGTRVVGTGVLVDNQGRFLAHRSVSSNPVLFGRLSSGETIQLSVSSVDEVTQLVVLQAEGWKPVGRNAALVQEVSSPSIQRASQSNAMRVILVLPDRAVRGELTQSNLVGVMAPSRRGLTLSEIRFEDPGGTVGGGLVFSMEGRLVGVVGATLDNLDPAQRDFARTQNSNTGFGTTQGGGGVSGLIPAAPKSFGPTSLTVGYTVTPDIIERVISGLLSPSRQVGHPALGLMCRDARGGGALVDSTAQGSPAQQAGVRPGDVIIELSGLPIRNQVEYTRVLLKQKVGDVVTLRLRRGNEELALQVKVGR